MIFGNWLLGDKENLMATVARHRSKQYGWKAAVAMVLTSCFLGSAFAQAGNCGALESSFGPFDYRTERGNNLYLVEMAHFTPVVEALIKGSTGYLGGDLNYTLIVFPNHHRALMSVMRYGEKAKSPQPKDLRYSVECYFDRAMRFKPDDTTVRLIYSTFLAKNARMPEALQQLEQTDAIAKDNPFTHYNIGLVYFDLKQYDKALTQAYKANELGFPQTGLRDQLQAAGKWKEPPPPTSDSASQPALRDPATAAPPADAASAPAAKTP